MSRNYEQHPEIFPALAVVEYDPDVNGGRPTRGPISEAWRRQSPITAASRSNRAKPCDCMQGGRPRSVEARSRMTLGTWA
jgi:hypothetical protein